MTVTFAEAAYYLLLSVGLGGAIGLLGGLLCGYLVFKTKNVDKPLIGSGPEGEAFTLDMDEPEQSEDTADGMSMATKILDKFSPKNNFQKQFSQDREPKQN